MDESGISLGFDADDSNIDISLLNSDELLRISPSEMESLNFYEIRSRPAPVTESPSFKTEIVKSRTQFKQQLMRDQLQKEREKKKLEEAKMNATIARSTNIKTPINIENVPLPQHVLQVKTGLQNPTKYHILEKQRNQVLQYLSTSQQGEGEFMLSRRDASSAPSAYARDQGASTSYRVSQPAPSPGVLSVASGTSDAEEVIEGILSYEESSLASFGSNASLDKIRDTSSLPTAAAGVKQEYYSYEDPLRERLKKDTHNMIERRRRYNINDRIKELGDLLPQRNELHFNILRDSRSNKGTILKSSVDYIKVLKNDAQKMKQLEQDNKQLQNENRKLLLKIQQLEIQAKSKGVEVADPTWRVRKPEAIIKQFIRSGPQAAQMPDVLSEAAYIHYDESMEEVDLPDPVLGATVAPLVPKVITQSMDFE